MWFIPDGEVGVPYEETPTPADFTAIDPWPDRDPSAPGIQLTYSYSNFLDGGLPGGLTPEQLMVATEEALQLWASAAPLHFREVEDSGPGLDDVDYPAASHPDVRIGHHFIDGESGPNVIAHAYFPVLSDGLSGDVHFDNGNTWSVHPSNGIDVIEVMAHELGHSLGLGHEESLDAIMNPRYGARFSGPGTGILLQDDINGIRNLYGTGVGSVTPLSAPNDLEFNVGEVKLDYDAATATATWDFANVAGVTPTWYAATVTASNVTDMNGLALDGDSDGTSGDDATFHFLVAQPGDGDLDGDVDIVDAIRGITRFDPSGISSGNSWFSGNEETRRVARRSRTGLEY